MLVLLLRVARQDGSSKAVCPITPHICGLQDLVLLRCKLGAASVRDYDHCVQHLDNHCFYYYLVDFSDHDILILLRSLFNCLLNTGMCFDMMVCASTYAGLYISCMHILKYSHSRGIFYKCIYIYIVLFFSMDIHIHTFINIKINIYAGTFTWHILLHMSHNTRV